MSFPATSSLRAAIVTEIDNSVRLFFSLDHSVEAKVQTAHDRTRRKALAFANQLARHNSDLTLSDCFVYAWDEMKQFGENYRFVRFTKVNGEVAVRIILAGHWSEHCTPKGNGRPLKAGQLGMIDAARKHSGTGRSFISTYVSSVLEIF